MTRFFVALALIMFCVGSAAAQEVTPQQVALIQKWEPAGDFREIVAKQFADRQNLQLDFTHLASIVAIPSKASGSFSLVQLAEGQDVGAMYIPSGSSRLNLPPGSYVVRVNRVGDRWQVQFSDGKRTVGAIQARVVGTAQAVPFPIAVVDHSVCYRADSWEICY